MHSIALLAVVALSLCVSTSLLCAQDESRPRGAAKFRKTAGLGENHELLQGLAGKFKASFKLWGMGTEPMKSEGTASGVSVLGGRFVRLNIVMPMMGRKMHHEVTLGHDNFKKEFDFTWLSDQATGTTRATGTTNTKKVAKKVAKKPGRKSDPRILTFKGIMHDAMAGKRPVRHVFDFHADKTVVFTTFDTLPNGKELKIMEITFVPVAK